MVIIGVICRENSTLLQALCTALGKTRRVVIATPDTFSSCCQSSCDILLYHSGSIRHFFPDCGILLFDQECIPDPEIQISAQTIAVLSPDNRPAMEAAIRNRLRTITCGLSGKDTVTLTSITSDNAVVALQRGLQTLRGRQIEPMEYPVQMEPCGEYGTMAMAVIFLLADLIDIG